LLKISFLALKIANAILYNILSGSFKYISIIRTNDSRGRLLI
jgi:hypothetical protein